MSAERRRTIAIVAALTVFAAVGVFWLARLVFDDTGARFEAPSIAGATASPETVAPPVPVDPPATEDLTETAAAGPGPAGSATPRTTRSSGRPVPPPTSSSPATRRPATSRPASTAPKTRTIEVGGVTLNNRNPRTMCSEWGNDLGMPVTIKAISVSGLLDINARECVGQSDVNGSPCRTGRPLPSGAFCFVGVVPAAGEPAEYRGLVTVSVTGRCTSAQPSACDVGDPPPSPDAPVRITWVQNGVEEVCFAVRAPDDENQSKFC